MYTVVTYGFKNERHETHMEKFEDAMDELRFNSGVEAVLKVEIIKDGRVIATSEQLRMD